MQKNKVTIYLIVMKNKITNLYLESRKTKDTVAKNLFSTLLGEIQKHELDTKKEITDSEIVVIVRKLLKGVDEILKVRATDEQAITEKAILSQFLPVMMAEEQIRDLILKSVLLGKSTMGEIMAVFKDLNADKKIVSQIVKEVL